jgi:iron complex outermembrane receptor protein
MSNKASSSPWRRLAIALGYSAAGCAVALTTQVRAEDGQPQHPAANIAASTTTASTTEEALQEIVVTAQRKAQDLERVPIAVSVVSQQQMANLNIKTIEEIERVTPDLNYAQGYSFSQIYIRGIGVSIPTPGLETPVAVYYDGAYMARGSGTSFDLFDMSSVEVLKGPQGTLYGRNATGGAILINTAVPTQSQEASGTLEYGRFNHALGDWMINLPVSDTFALRIAGRYTREGGYLENLYNDTHPREFQKYGTRIKGKWDPSKDFSAIFTLEYGNNRILGSSAARLTGNASNCLACQLGVTPVSGFYQVDENEDHWDPNRSYSANLQLSYTAGDLQFKSVTSYRDLTDSVIAEIDHSPLDLGYTDRTLGGKTYTQNLQVVSSFGGWIDFLAGAEYDLDKSFIDFSIYSPALGLPKFSPSLPYTGNEVETNSYATFAELYIKPIDEVTLTLGGRYSRDDRKLSFSDNPTALDFISGNPAGPAAATQKDSFKRPTPRAVLAYDAGAANLYVSYTSGFKAGGFNTPVFAPQVNPILPEKIDSFEIGAKLVSEDRRARLNAAAFHYNYRDVQVSLVNQNNSGLEILNAAAAHGNGIELDGSYHVTDALTLTSGGSFLGAKYTNYPNAAIYVVAPGGLVTQQANLAGTPLPQAPRWSGFGSANLNVPVGSWTGRLNVVGHYTSSYDFFPDAGGELQADRQGGLFLANMSAGMSPPGGRYELGFYIDNLTDKKYYEIVQTSGPGVFKVPAPPITFGARVSMHY